jgi:hypothetical protein
METLLQPCRTKGNSWQVVDKMAIVMAMLTIMVFTLFVSFLYYFSSKISSLKISKLGKLPPCISYQFYYWDSQSQVVKLNCLLFNIFVLPEKLVLLMELPMEVGAFQAIDCGINTKALGMTKEMGHDSVLRLKHTLTTWESQYQHFQVDFQFES